MLKGIAASSGITIAKAYKLETPVLNVVQKTGCNAEEEVARYQRAVDESRAEIEKVKEKAAAKLSDEELAIFDAHLMVVDDPAMAEEVETMCREQGVNADYALETIANNYIAMFESLDDAYMRERAADIRDVTRRILHHLLGIKVADLSLIDEESVVVAHDLTPSDTAALDKEFTKGFATEIGGRTSHKGIMEEVNNGDLLILDALKGEVLVNPDAETVEVYRQKAREHQEYVAALKVLKDQPTVTTDGHKVLLVGNIGTPEDVNGVLDNGGEGVGLYRTEFLYMGAAALPTEQEQFEAYKKVLEAMNPRPVVVRTLDIGGDKKLPYLPIDEEMNPFLGYRAIRLCLDRKEIFRTQLRALIRASAYGKLCIMFPMIATLGEFRAAKGIYEEEKAKLIEEGVPVADDIEVGMMVEIPASAVLADQFAKEADFFSIGTNDLIQYSMAADRMSEKVAYLYQPLNPAILRLVKMTIDGAHSQGRWCGMCGEMGGDPMAAPVLLGLGLDEFSMSASKILPTRKIIISLNKKEMEDLAGKALKCHTEAEVIPTEKEALNK